MQFRGMLAHQPSRGGCACRAARIARTPEFGADVIEHPFDIRLDERPGALVLGLLLAPDELGVREAAQLLDERARRERIELLDAHQVDVVCAAVLAFLEQVVINLARAQHDALDPIVGHKLDLVARADLRMVPKHAMERRAGAEILQPRHHALMAQERLRRHQDQRFTEAAMQLAPQDVEVVGGRRAVGDLPIVLGRQLQVAFEARR